MDTRFNQMADHSGCCGAWDLMRLMPQGQLVTTSDRKYSDADLAREMNAMTFEERQEMEEEIHGVSDTINETPEFLDTKIAEMRECIGKVPNGEKRAAWDRAVFLRPALALDRDQFIMFLRAKRYLPMEATNLLLSFYSMKRDLYGEDLLIHRICWTDLTEEEQEMVRAGTYRIIPNRERVGRGIGYNPVHRWDVQNKSPITFLRSSQYICLNTIQDSQDIQKNGVVNVVDLRKVLDSSNMQGNLQVVQFIIQLAPVAKSQPIRHPVTHHLFSVQANDNFLKRGRAFFPRDFRIRNRMHGGSDIELAYSLNQFGIDIGDCLMDEDQNNPISRSSMEAEIKKLQAKEEEWRKSEAPYRDPKSKIALFPNPQDIILGRNKKIASTWPGNLVYTRLIEQYGHRYAQAKGHDRIDKTLLTVEFIHVVQTEYRARFLVRKEAVWEVASMEETQIKVSQAMRFQARQLQKSKK